MKYLLNKAVFLTIYLFIAVVASVDAKTVNLAWDPSPGPDVVGYKLYYKSGTSSLPFTGTGAVQGASPVDVGSNLVASLSGLPDEQVHYISVTAYDSAGYESAYSNVVTSAAVGSSTNQPPVLVAIGSKSVIEGATLIFTVSAGDPDGDSLTYSATGLPSGSLFNPATRTFSWTPNTSQSGSYNLNFSVSDGSLTDSETVSINVGNLNQAPILTTIGDKIVTEGTTLSFTISGTDPDIGSLSYSVSGLPGGSIFSPATRTFSWTPNTSQSGNYNLSFRVSDGSLIDSEIVTISVQNLNQPPMLDFIGSKTVNEEASLSFIINASDPDADNLVYSVSGLPGGSSFNPATRTFSWTPNTSQSGSYNLSFRVSDGSLIDSETVLILVGNQNRAPVLAAIGSKSINVDANLTFAISASDLDADSLTYSVTGLPSGANFNTSSLVLDWTPDNSQAGNYPLTFRVSDGSLSDSETVTISVGSNLSEGLRLLPQENGLPGVERIDGGDDSNNYVNGMPKGDIAYIFRVMLQDSFGGVPPKVVLSLNGFAYEMVYESGSLSTGATYAFTTRLGPIPEQRFHFETRDSSENLLSRFPLDVELAGPQVELLNGKNLVGALGNLAPLQLSSVEAIGTSLSYRWMPGPTNGGYALIDSGAAISLGEGYVMKRTTTGFLPTAIPYGENPASSYEIPVKTGWNLIANPYGGNVSLTKILVRIGSSVPINWAEAAAGFLVVDGIYFFAGNDWGNSNIFESSTGVHGAVLIPRIGYWVYVNSVDETVSLIVPRPQK